MLNTTKDEVNESADKDVKLKIKQEGIIKKELASAYFSKISSDFFNTYSELGAIPSLLSHHLQLNTILNKNYNNTANKFKNNIRGALGRPENASGLNDAINENLKLFQNVNVSLSSKSIANTTEKDLNKSVNDTKKAAIAAGLVLTNFQIAVRARRKFNSLSKSRLDTIGMTQTQQSSEGAKDTEASVLIKNSAFFPGAGITITKAIIRKEWVTKMDNRVRTAHVLAEGQKVLFRSPFIVGGELLKHPGDRSLGASSGNVINCRCSSVVSIR